MELPALISLAWFWTKESFDTVSHKTRRQFPHLFKLERYQTTLLLLLLISWWWWHFQMHLFFFFRKLSEGEQQKVQWGGAVIDTAKKIKRCFCFSAFVFSVGSLCAPSSHSMLSGMIWTKNNHFFVVVVALDRELIADDGWHQTDEKTLDSMMDA